MKKTIMALGLIAVVLVSGTGQATTTIYNNGGPVLPCEEPGPCGAVADAWFLGIPSQEIADDFVLNPGENTITDIHWWGSYFPYDTATEIDDFTIRIYADDGGVPGVVQVTINVGDGGRSSTGSQVWSVATGAYVDLYEYGVVIDPLTLDSGTKFWLSIQNNTVLDQGNAWGWAYSGVGSGVQSFRRDAGPWYTSNNEMAFYLTAVPEPTSLTRLALGLAGLAAARRRKQ